MMINFILKKIYPCRIIFVEALIHILSFYFDHIHSPEYFSRNILTYFYQ